MVSKKRERLEVIRDILKTVRDAKKIKPTRLLYASNLSPQMFKDYVSELSEKGFIKLDIEEKKGKKDKDKDKKTFSITARGNDFLQEYRLIESFIENFGL